MAVVGRERLPAIKRHAALCSEGTISEDLLPFRLMNERMKNLAERIELETVENARHSIGAETLVSGSAFPPRSRCQGVLFSSPSRALRLGRRRTAVKKRARIT